MNISFVSSEKFLYGAKVMLISFLENNDFEEHNIFWLYSDVKDSVIKEFCDFFLEKYNQIIIPFELTEEMLDSFYKSKTFGVAAFHKLFVFGLLPVKCDRILSLDADAIVDGSLRDFYYQDINDYCVAASQDLWISDNALAERKLQRNQYTNLGNSLFNLANYLEKYNVNDFVKFANENREKIPYVAQDVVNYMLQGDIKHCDAFKYNLQIFSRIRIDKHVALSLKKQINAATKSKPVIIHYIRQTKPWDYNYCFGYRSYFAKYEKIMYSKSQWLGIKIKRFFSIIVGELKFNIERVKQLCKR